MPKQKGVQRGVTNHIHKIGHGKSVKKGKFAKVMHEFKEHHLHSGSKNGPIVTNRKQSIAIALSESRRAKK